MHYDDKEEDRGSRRTRKAAFAERGERGERRDREERKDRPSKAPRGRLNAKSSKPNVHAQTERSSSRKNNASAYKKSNKKAERF